jgi:hypothetical protein
MRAGEPAITDQSMTEDALGRAVDTCDTFFIRAARVVLPTLLSSVLKSPLTSDNGEFFESPADESLRRK